MDKTENASREINIEEGLKNPVNQSEVMDLTTENLEKIVDENLSEIEKNKAEILSSAEKTVNDMPSSIGIDPEKAESIFVSGGFSEKIKSGIIDIFGTQN